MTATLISAPQIEPVSLAEMKTYLRIDQSLEDDLLRAFISSARLHLEYLSGHHFISQQWRLLVQAPLGEKLSLPLQPAQSITSAAILSDEGDLVALASDALSIYQAMGPAIITNPSGLILTSRQRLQLDMETGFGPTADDVPEPLRHALKMVVAEWYERRLIADPDQLPSLAAAIRPMLASYRTVRL